MFAQHERVKGLLGTYDKELAKEKKNLAKKSGPKAGPEKSNQLQQFVEYAWPHASAATCDHEAYAVLAEG